MSNQVIEVTAQTPLLQTEERFPRPGRRIPRKCCEMPLNGRNVFGLVALVPGVVPGGQSGTTPTGTNPFAWGNYQIGGGQSNQSAAFIDGAPINAVYSNLTALVPTQDAIQEFRVQTNNLGPEFGQLAGGAINLTTKSGTNAFHGSCVRVPAQQVSQREYLLQQQGRRGSVPRSRRTSTARTWAAR